ncbi:MAG: dihydrodipicolinate reductase C-terminal domain-containing protein, partial [Pseudomonadota bacterium]
MNVGILGYGKMGRGLEKASEGRHKVVVKADSLVELQKIPENTLETVDVFFEFTMPDAAKENILYIIKNKANAKIVCGTTGWDIKEIEKEITKSNAMVMYGSNFSLGVNAVLKTLAELSFLISKTDKFTASIKETHHINKKDKPSGTAKTLAAVIEKAGLKCPITSVREGELIGTHVITFES